MSQPKPESSQQGKKWVTAKYLGQESQNETAIELAPFECPVEQLARVKVGYGLTINLGNFESARVDAGVELPVYPEEIRPAFAEAWRICGEEIQSQVVDMRSKAADLARARGTKP